MFLNELTFYFLRREFFLPFFLVSLRVREEPEEENAPYGETNDYL